MLEGNGRYAWNTKQEEIKVKEKILKDYEVWWQIATHLAGYKSIEDYQNDIFPKYKLKDDEPAVPLSKKWIRVLGWISREMGNEDRRESEEEISILAKMAMILVDADKHHLDWKKAADDFGAREIIDKYIMRHPQ